MGSVTFGDVLLKNVFNFFFLKLKPLKGFIFKVCFRMGYSINTGDKSQLQPLPH